MKRAHIIEKTSAYNKALQLTVKSVAIFAKQKYAPLSPAAELNRYAKNNRKGKIMKVISLALLLLLTNTAIAEISTLKEADVFLEKYCISLINRIEVSMEKQNNQILKKNWKGENEIDTSIKEISSVYSNLCTNNHHSNK